MSSNVEIAQENSNIQWHILTARYVTNEEPNLLRDWVSLNSQDCCCWPIVIAKKIMREWGLSYISLYICENTLNLSKI